MEQLIAALLALGIEFGPTLVSDVSSVIKGNPQPAGMSDADYIALLTTKVAANTATVDQEDDAIQKPSA